MADVPFPRGVRDLLPNEALFRDEVLKKIEEVYRRFGFLTIDTPSFESLKILNAKGAIGEESKLIYEMKFEDIALRYDLTVSLARYMAMHQSLPMPFKRYAIGKAWRREEPQRLRFREFTQADIDIVGGRTSAADAEIIAAGATALGAIGIEYRVQVSNRKFLDGLFAAWGVPNESLAGVMRAIDKLNKIGRDGVVEQLQKLGLQRDIISKIDSMLSLAGTNEEKLAFIEKDIKDKSSLNEIREMLGLLELYNLNGEVNIDLSVVRGLDYYTGIVFEYMLADSNEKNSIGGGGRYDNLIGIFSNKALPAVGVSLGIDRLLELLNFSASKKQSYADVYIATIDDKNYPYALQIASAFRLQGINVDLNVATRNISNQLAYANSLSFKYAIIVGESEEKEKKVKLRNLIDGNESTVSIEEALQTVKGK